MGLKIRQEPVWTGFGHDWLPRDLAKAISKHAKDSDEPIDGSLTLSILKADSTDSRAVLKVRLEGEINGRPFQKSCTAVRTASVGVGSHMFGLIGVLVTHVITALVFKAAHAAARADDKFTQCFAECVATLEASIDRAVGKESSAHTRRWEMGHLIGRLSILITIAVIMYLERNARWKFGIVSGVLMPALTGGIFIGGSIYVLVWMINLMTMPDRFFLAEPAGRKALARSGVSKPRHMRILAVLISIIPTIVLVLTFLVFLKARR